MKKIELFDLLRTVLKYDFYNWEDGEKNKNRIIFGIPDNLLNELGFLNFYDSWGFDAVNNPYAQPSMSLSQWLKLEEVFFRWLKEAENILFTRKELIATPSLETNWLMYETEQFEPSIIAEYERYLDMLENSGVIEFPPSLKEPCRGGAVESFDELIILAKMAIKGVPLVFLSDGDMIIRITDYLTIQIFFRNKELMDEVVERIRQLNAQVLE